MRWSKIYLINVNLSSCQFDEANFRGDVSKRNNLIKLCLIKLKDFNIRIQTFWQIYYYLQCINNTLRTCIGYDICRYNNWILI